MLTPELIEKVLREIGCENIRHYSNRITSTRIGGDNAGSVCVWIDNPSLYTNIYTQAQYESQPIKDIIAAVGYMLNLSFPQTMKKICEICGFDYYQDLNEPERPLLLDFLDQIEGSKPLVFEDSKDDKIRILSEKVLDQFVKLPYYGWIKEGITAITQRFYEVGFDPYSERVIFPIRDAIGTLMGIKGRTINPNDGNKYLYLYSAPKSQLLYGEYQNTETIKKANECIVVEAAKSVMKLHSLGFKNAVSIEGKSLSEIQAQNLQRLNVPITIALDQGVEDFEINEIVKKLQYPVQIQPIYVIRDSLGLYLEDKESPCDNKDSWIELYNNFKELV